MADHIDLSRSVSGGINSCAMTFVIDASLARAVRQLSPRDVEVLNWYVAGEVWRYLRDHKARQAHTIEVDHCAGTRKSRGEV
jgi:hypothetical protein